MGVGVKLPLPQRETAVPGTTVALATKTDKGDLSSHFLYLLLLG